jgi:GTPase SAR1 family protein
MAKAEACECAIFVAAYYRGAMGILLVYDVTDESSFNSTDFTLEHSLRWLSLLIMLFLLTFADIRNWIRNIEQHASDNVSKILVGNKADMDESKRVCNQILPVLTAFYLDSKSIFVSVCVVNS